MTEWNFDTPTVLEGPIGDHRLFMFYRLNRALSVVLTDAGNYETVRYEQDSELLKYPVVYRGGYHYTVDDATKAALINADIGITEENFTAI
jgi:hypothetical protein